MENLMSQCFRAFRANVRSLMDEQQISLRQLGEKTGMSYSGLSRIINGKENLTLSRAEKIAEALGVELPDLLRLPKKIA